MTQRTIAADSKHAPPSFARTLASLPVTYIAASGAAADVVTVAGVTGWARRAAELIGEGASGVIVVNPDDDAPEDVRALADRADERSAVVELAERYAGDPGLALHGEHLTAHLMVVSTIFVTEIGPRRTPASAALSVTRSLRALGQTPRLTDIWTTDRAVMMRGAASAIQIEGIVAAGAVQVGQKIQALGFSRALRLSLHGEDSARPAEIVVANMNGETALPAVYETAERAAWRRVHAALESGRRDSAALRVFADDLAAIHAL